MKKKILIVDDEQEAVEILEKKIKEGGYDCLATSSGKEAIALSAQEKPDVVILDIIIGDMDGYTVAAAIREEKPLKDVPIIFMTGKELDYKAIENRLSEIGYCNYVAKPFAIQDLLAKIQEAINYSEKQK